MLQDWIRMRSRYVPGFHVWTLSPTPSPAYRGHAGADWRMPYCNAGWPRAQAQSLLCEPDGCAAFIVFFQPCSSPSLLFAEASGKLCDWFGVLVVLRSPAVGTLDRVNRQNDVKLYAVINHEGAAYVQNKHRGPRCDTNSPTSVQARQAQQGRNYQREQRFLAPSPDARTRG